MDVNKFYTDLKKLHKVINDFSEETKECIWEKQEPSNINHFDNLPKSQQAAIYQINYALGMLNFNIKEYLDWFKVQNNIK